MGYELKYLSLVGAGRTKTIFHSDTLSLIEARSGSKGLHWNIVFVLPVLHIERHIF